MNLPAGVRVFERGWLSSNNILLQQAGGASLIDSGYGTHAAQTIALLEQGLGNAPLTQIVNTHCHSDHVGGNAAIRRRFGCRIVIPKGEAPLVERWDEDALLYRYADQFCERFEFDATCAPGDVLRLGSIDWQVLAAPGHDAHAVMLHAPAERLLISGDALWENGFGVIFAALDGSIEPFAQTRATLEMIAALDVRIVIPGHGRVFTGVEAALERAFSRLAAFERDVGRMARHIAKVMLSFTLLDKREISLATLPDYVARVPILRDINARWLKLEPEAFAASLVSDLERAGAVACEGGMLRTRSAA